MKIMKMMIMILCFCSSGQAFDLRKVPSEHSQIASLQSEIHLTCTSEEVRFCKFSCEQEQRCLQIEPFCYNCAGTSSIILRSLLTQFHTHYFIGEQLPNDVALLFLSSASFILLSADDLYNYYVTKSSGASKRIFEGLCLDAAEEAMIVLELDDSHSITNVPMVLCRRLQNGLYARRIQFKKIKPYLP